MAFDMMKSWLNWVELFEERLYFCIDWIIVMGGIVRVLCQRCNNDAINNSLVVTIDIDSAFGWDDQRVLVAVL